MNPSRSDSSGDLSVKGSGELRYIFDSTVCGNGLRPINPTLR